MKIYHYAVLKEQYGLEIRGLKSVGQRFFQKRLTQFLYYLPAFRLPNSEFQHGGDERIRTADPLLARQVLSQLSYTPMFKREED